MERSKPMTLLSIAPDYRARKVQAALDGFLAQHGAVAREIVTVRDVVLGNGSVLPNRRLVRRVFDLDDGRTVEVKGTSRYDGVSNNTAHGYEINEVGA